MTGLSLEEKRAIATLKRLAKNWPKTLWLMQQSDSTVLRVMRKHNGEAAIGQHREYDIAFQVAEINLRVEACV